MLLAEVKETETRCYTFDFVGARLTFHEIRVNGTIDHCYSQLSFIDSPACLYCKYDRSQYGTFRAFQHFCANTNFRNLEHLADECKKRGMY